MVFKLSQHFQELAKTILQSLEFNILGVVVFLSLSVACEKINIQWIVLLIITFGTAGP